MTTFCFCDYIVNKSMVYETPLFYYFLLSTVLQVNPFPMSLTQYSLTYSFYTYIKEQYHDLSLGRCFPVLSIPYRGGGELTLCWERNGRDCE